MDRARGRGAKRRSRTGAREFRGGVSEKDVREMRGVKVDGDAMDLKGEKSKDEIEQDLAGQRCREMHGEGQG